MWIDGIAPSEATGELKQLYDRIGGARGGVAQIHQAQSLNPKVLATHFELYKALMFQSSPLSRADREAIAVAVSRANSCEYCAAHHGDGCGVVRRTLRSPRGFSSVPRPHVLHNAVSGESARRSS